MKLLQKGLLKSKIMKDLDACEPVLVQEMTDSKEKDLEHAESDGDLKCILKMELLKTKTMGEPATCS